MATQTFTNEQRGIDPATYSPRPKQLVLRPYSENEWGMGRMYAEHTGRPLARFPKGDTAPASDLALVSFDERHADGLQLNDPEWLGQLRAWHAARGFIDAAEFEENRVVGGRYVGPADLERDLIDARGFYTNEVHYITGRPWDQSLRDAFSNPVCPIAPFAHRLTESWFDYNQGQQPFSLPVITRLVEG